MPRSTTIRDIAAKVGVHPSTVSRALQNRPNVSPEIRARIDAAAQEMGYKPNPMIVALMKQVRTNRAATFRGNLAFLDWCAERADYTKIPVLQRIFTGARQAAADLGFNLDRFFPMADSLSRRSLERILQARGITGVLLFIYVEQDFKTRRSLKPFPNLGDVPLAFEKLTTAVIGGKFHQHSPHFAQTDQYISGRTVAEKILGGGFQRPGILTSNYIDTVTEGRFSAGVHSLWSRHRDPASLRTKIIDERDLDTALKFVREEKLDLVISYNSSLLPVLRERGYAVPGELGFISMDVSPQSDISGIDQLHEDVGGAAVRLVVNQLNNGESGIPQVTRGVFIEGNWVPGTTLHKDHSPDTTPRGKGNSSNLSVVSDIL